MKKQSWTPDWPGNSAPRLGQGQGSKKRVVLKRSLLLHAIFNSENFSLIATDADGVIQIFNVGAERMLGYKAADVINRISPADLSLPTELLARAVQLTLELGTPISPGFDAMVHKARKGIEDIYELNYLRHDGTSIPAMVSVTALRDPHWNVIGYLLIGTDNTARCQAEDLLARHRITTTGELQRFRRAMDATADAILLVRRSTMRLIEVNATACMMLGYSRAELFAIHPAILCFDALLGKNLEQEFDLLIRDAVSAIKVRPAALRRKDGSQLEGELHLQAQHSAGEWIIVATISDVTDRVQAARSMYQLAYYDNVTALPNRRFFQQKLNSSLDAAAVAGGALAVVYIDLDHFKNVNDTLGHAAGDELLKQFAVRLRACLRADDTACRLGGDEFALILSMAEPAQGAAVIAAKIGAALAQPFQLKGDTVFVTASMGITVYPDDGADAESLLKFADTAMYHAKAAGRDGYRFFSPAMTAQIGARLALDAALRQAVARKQFVLHYQPKLALHDGQCCGVEILLRWLKPGGGLVLPQQFLPSLERTGLIAEVGAWVIDSACAQLAAWAGTPLRDMAIAVNVASQQFSDGDLPGDVLACLARHGARPELLELEITESTLMANTTLAVNSLHALRAAGVRIAIDDFGTGLSSLAYLSRFAVDTLKIDVSFIDNMVSNANDATIVRAMISLAHNLNLTVLAEGVESELQLDYLRAHGCDQVQGSLLGMPEPLSIFELRWKLAAEQLPGPVAAAVDLA